MLFRSLIQVAAVEGSELDSIQRQGKVSGFIGDGATSEEEGKID